MEFNILLSFFLLVGDISLLYSDPSQTINCGKIWNDSRFCVSSLRRGHANLLCIVAILVYVLPRLARQIVSCKRLTKRGCIRDKTAIIFELGLI